MPSDCLSPQGVTPQRKLMSPELLAPAGDWAALKAAVAVVLMPSILALMPSMPDNGPRTSVSMISGR